MFKKNAKPAKSAPAKKSRVKEVAEQPQGYHRLEIPNSASSSATSSTLVTVMVLAAAVVIGAVVTVASLWKFVHPDLTVEIPNISALTKIAAGQDLQSFNFPPQWKEEGERAIPDIADKIDELQSSASDLFKQIPDADVAEYMHEICLKVWEGKDPAQIVEALQRDFLTRVPGLEGQDALAQELVDKALSLCPANEN